MRRKDLSSSKPDALQAFVSENREAFDDELPSDSVWLAIEAQLPEELRSIDLARARQTPSVQGEEVGLVRQLYPYFRKAAIACMLVIIGVLGGLHFAGNTTSEEVASDSIEERVSEIESYYQREIDRRLKLVASYQPEPQLRRELADMSQLELREDSDLSLVAPGSERAILEAMANEYQAKLNALEHVLSQLRDAEKAQIKFNQPGPRGKEQL